MAPNRGQSKPSSRGSKKGSSKGPIKGPVGKGGRPAKRATSGPLKKEQRKAAVAPPKAPPKKKKHQRSYTDAELSLPKLNMITPAGVQKPKGKKKGKVFVDDPESMMTILAIVNAEKEGQIESQMVKARQLEEIREARRKEQERKVDLKKEKLEEVKDSLRKRRRRRKDEESGLQSPEEAHEDHDGAIKKKKRVSFA